MNARADPGLLIVTNRLPFALQRVEGHLERHRAAGGLASALDPALRRCGGTWIGWPGAAPARGESVDLRDLPYRVHPVALSDREVARYYHGFGERALRPLFHSLPSRARFDARDWPVYRDVNRRFANAVLPELGEDGLVWIHDYPLMLTPHYLRRYLSRARLAFFLHIPFPPFDVLRVAPWARELLRGLCACDLVGFHVESYVRNFLDCAERLLAAEVDWKHRRLHYGGRAVQVGAFPIGIDFDAFEARVREAPPQRPGARRILLGADRLDYTKGIPERLLAFERLLERHPEHRERVTLVQIAVPSRSRMAEYRILKRRIEEIVGRVNGRFATSAWSPIQYLHRSLPPERLALLYRDADVCVVTPLRDGMNLVAKEYVACQVGDPGVLVLSALAGAAETMKEALLVNPYDPEKTADRLHRALEMPLAERVRRVRALRERERRMNVHAWAASFLAAAGRCRAAAAA